MQECGACRVDPELKEMVAEASRALALLDADRLEELARACQALNRQHLDRTDVARQAREAAAGMAVFARVLDATRSNLLVMNRLRALRQGRLDYADAGFEPARRALPETSHGDD